MQDRNEILEFARPLWKQVVHVLQINQVQQGDASPAPRDLVKKCHACKRDTVCYAEFRRIYTKNAKRGLFLLRSNDEFNVLIKMISANTTIHPSGTATHC